MKQIKNKYTTTELKYAVVPTKLWKHKNDNVVKKPQY